MKNLKDCLINEAEFCKPNDICYKVLNKDGEQICVYLPYTGFGEGEELKNKAEAMAKAKTLLINVKLKLFAIIGA